MSKDQKKTNSLNVETVENIKLSCKMINEIRMGLKYWKFDQIWPTNLYSNTLNKIAEIMNDILIKEDINNSVSLSHIIDK